MSFASRINQFGENSSCHIVHIVLTQCGQVANEFTESLQHDRWLICKAHAFNASLTRESWMPDEIRLEDLGHLAHIN